LAGSPAAVKSVVVAASVHGIDSGLSGPPFLITWNWQDTFRSACIDCIVSEDPLFRLILSFIIVSANPHRPIFHRNPVDPAHPWQSGSAYLSE
jgi:hypothetical protein